MKTGELGEVIGCHHTSPCLTTDLYFDDGLTVVDVEPVDALVSNHFENGHDLPDFRKVAEELEAAVAEAAAVYS